MPRKHGRTKCLRSIGKIPDILVVEPSECDRWESNQLDDLVEGCWLYSRPPPVLYGSEPVVTARRAEVARYWISGDGEEPVYVMKELTTCGEKRDPKSVPKFHENRRSLPPATNAKERLRKFERKSLSLE